MTKRLFLYSLASLLVVGLVSCGTPKSVYKDFYAGQSFQKAGILTDATALQDAKGKQENFLTQESADLLRILTTGTQAQLRAKGYQTYDQYQSTGLSVPAEMVAFVSNDRKAKEGSPLEGAHTFTRGGKTPTTTQKYAAERLFERLFTLNLLSKSTRDATFPEVKDLGVPNDRYLVVVSGLSRNVNTGKQVGQALLLAAVSFGTVVAWEPDAAVMQVALIDPRTQKIVWANQIQGGKGKEKSINKSIAKLFKTLPAYGTGGE